MTLVQIAGAGFIPGSFNEIEAPGAFCYVPTPR